MSILPCYCDQQANKQSEPQWTVSDAESFHFSLSSLSQSGRGLRQRGRSLLSYWLTWTSVWLKWITWQETPVKSLDDSRCACVCVCFKVCKQMHVLCPFPTACLFTFCLYVCVCVCVCVCSPSSSVFVWTRTAWTLCCDVAKPWSNAANQLMLIMWKAACWSCCDAAASSTTTLHALTPAC